MHINLKNYLYKQKNKIKSYNYYLLKEYELCTKKPSYSKLPDFLIIGAQKAGTSWLHQTLNSNENFFLPSIEGTHDPTEIRFFDQRFNRSLEWYSELFKGKESLIKGDKTPKYYLIPNFKIRFIRKFNPEIKIIFILRNPIERAWSNALMNFHRFNGISYEEDPQRYQNFLKGTFERGAYSYHIKRWLKYIPRKNFYIGLYDHLKRDPAGFLEGISGFLGVPDIDWNPDVLNQKANTNPKIEMPENIRKLLEESYLTEIKNLQKNFPIEVDHWLKNE